MPCGVSSEDLTTTKLRNVLYSAKGKRNPHSYTLYKTPRCRQLEVHPALETFPFRIHMTTSTIYSNNSNAQQTHTADGSSCKQGDSDLSAQTTFDVKSLSVQADTLTSSAVQSSEALRKLPRQYAQTVDRGLTKKVAPKGLRERIRFVALQTVDDFRYVRTLDVAVACFAERPFPAALAAAQRAMRGMSRDGLVQEYVTDRHQHI